ncbi:MAG: hypothetical protein JRF43_05225 [Deltaproteobacteria bacterium]|nr:hypothetical protein [Deltaproteobacteria bacterium]
MINRKQDNLTMIQISADLAKLYTSFMEQKGVEIDQHQYIHRHHLPRASVSGPPFRSTQEKAA